MKKLDNSEDDELRPEAPKFFGIEKRNNFEVPEGYFENLPHLIQERCVEVSKKRSWLEVVLAYLLQPRIALTSICLLVVSCAAGILLYLNSPKASTEDTLSFYMNELDETSIVESVTQDNSSAETQEDKAIDDYLINNNVDPTIILN